MVVDASFLVTAILTISHQITYLVIRHTVTVATRKNVTPVPIIVGGVSIVFEKNTRITKQESKWGG